MEGEYTYSLEGRKGGSKEQREEEKRRKGSRCKGRMERRDVQRDGEVITSVLKYVV